MTSSLFSGFLLFDLLKKFNGYFSIMVDDLKSIISMRICMANHNFNYFSNTAGFYFTHSECARLYIKILGVSKLGINPVIRIFMHRFAVLDEFMETYGINMCRGEFKRW